MTNYYIVSDFLACTGERTDEQSARAFFVQCKSLLSRLSKQTNTRNSMTLFHGVTVLESIYADSEGCIVVVVRRY